MPTTVQSIVTAANKEWNFWGKSTWNVPKQQASIVRKDDDPAFAQYVIDNYCSVGGGTPNLWDIQNDDYAWSAVGMSAIMKNAGFTSAEFKFAQSHSVFIRAFVKARLNGDTSAAFWGYRHKEAGSAPEIGDIVGYARTDNPASFN